ncbi:hypothetical protein E2C01_003331 [Portunus trituberculatus]|uniref:Uncharacterized protein n=1 Tax=Portunus trituberculatus TaxID=210409 RepID=A0A5B7CPH7_PORTR|nr:hypothetical protein [Portunus trituberculatus]
MRGRCPSEALGMQAIPGFLQRPELKSDCKSRGLRQLDCRTCHPHASALLYTRQNYSQQDFLAATNTFISHSLSLREQNVEIRSEHDVPLAPPPPRTAGVAGVSPRVPPAGPREATAAEGKKTQSQATHYLKLRLVQAVFYPRRLSASEMSVSAVCQSRGDIV